jgi:hypothetical protein
VAGAAERLQTFVDEVPAPSCCGLIDRARAVLPYENAPATAALLIQFLAANFDACIAAANVDACIATDNRI